VEGGREGGAGDEISGQTSAPPSLPPSWSDGEKPAWQLPLQPLLLPSPSPPLPLSLLTSNPYGRLRVLLHQGLDERQELRLEGGVGGEETGVDLAMLQEERKEGWREGGTKSVKTETQTY